MLHIKSQAIVISAIRYKEADLIIKLLVKEKGLITFLVKNVLKSKKGKLKISFFQLGTLLEVDFRYKTNRNFQFFSEARPIIHTNSLHSNISKISIVTFLFEILNQVIQVEEIQEDLFIFLKESLLWLNDNDHVSLFHSCFLLKLTSFLGCYPDFDNPNFQEFQNSNNSLINASTNRELNKNQIFFLKTLLGTNFDDLRHVEISKNDRKEILNQVLIYYSFHVAGYQQPKSLPILEQIFS